MSISESTFCDVTVLLRAYRKAKVDIYYERDQDLSYAICMFESDLLSNLEQLQLRIRSRDWMHDPKIVGGVRYAPKSITPDNNGKHAGNSTIHTGRAGRWKALGEKPEIDFRAHCHSSVEWHVLSALWVAKVGHKIDALLDRTCYGNRVRRVTPRDLIPDDKDHHLGKFHEFGLGSFESYLPAYRKWRDEGLAVINKQLEAEIPVIAVSADVSKFYHEIDASFMTSPAFLTRLAKPALLDAEQDFHRDMIESIVFWAAENDTKKRGLPVGLGASRIIANSILVEFDEAMLKRVKPLYYGRYVDDVFMVIKDVGTTDSLELVWKELGEQLNHDVAGMVSVEPEAGVEPFKVKITPSYAGNLQSPLIFSGRKQKAFFLEHVGGPTLMASIQNHIHETSSVWNRLPELSESEELADLCFLAHNGSPSETADVLRKADVVSIRRSHFAMRLRDLEAICEDLAPDQWKDIRRVFIDTVRREIAETHELFNFSSYLPRVLSLAVASNDLTNAKKLVNSIRTGFKDASEALSKLEAKERELKRPKLKDARCRLGEQMLIAISRAWPKDTGLSTAAESRWEHWADKVARNFGASRLLWPYNGETSRRLSVAHDCLCSRDLGLRPFRAELFGEGARETLKNAPTFSGDLKGWWGPTSRNVHTWLAEFLAEMWGSPQQDLPAPMLFPTRPFSFAELTLLSSSRGKGRLVAKKLARWLQSLRGTFGAPDKDFGNYKDENSDLEEVHFPIDLADASGHHRSGKIKVAITCFLTEESSFRAAVNQESEPSSDRYRRATKLINAILRSRAKPDYIMFPELSLRENWFNRFAIRLGRSGISLVAGLDHQIAPGTSTGPRGPYQLVNQVRCGLVTTAPGYPSVAFYVHNKQEPAPIERAELNVINRSTLSNGGISRRNIVVHGAWRFGVLICNELTDLELRTDLRGKVDGLIVPEWNRDVNSFNALVEATSLDLPAYVIQINNRCYGDSRVRQPHQDAWMRDLTQVKGGELDYFTVVSLNINALRFFQTHAISPDKPYKPVPTGFEIHAARRRIQP